MIAFSDFLSIIKYSFKMTLSNKLILCILFAVFIPFAINFPGGKGQLLLFEMYLPLLAIILFCDITDIEPKYRMAEGFYLVKLNKLTVYMSRVMIQLLLLLGLFVLTLSICQIKSMLTGGEASGWLDLQFIMKALFISFPTALLVGTASMLFTSITKNVYVGCLLSICIWVYWNINSDKMTMFNIFSYSSGYTYYIYSKIVLCVMSLFIVLALNLWKDRSPIF